MQVPEFSTKPQGSHMVASMNSISLLHFNQEQAQGMYQLSKFIQIFGLPWNQCLPPQTQPSERDLATAFRFTPSIGSRKLGRVPYPLNFPFNRLLLWITACLAEWPQNCPEARSIPPKNKIQPSGSSPSKKRLHRSFWGSLWSPWGRRFQSDLKQFLLMRPLYFPRSQGQGTISSLLKATLLLQPSSCFLFL